MQIDSTQARELRFKPASDQHRFDTSEALQEALRKDYARISGREGLARNLVREFNTLPVEDKIEFLEIVMPDLARLAIEGDRIRPVIVMDYIGYYGIGEKFERALRILAPEILEDMPLRGPTMEEALAVKWHVLSDDARKLAAAPLCMDFSQGTEFQNRMVAAFPQMHPYIDAHMNVSAQFDVLLSYADLHGMLPAVANEMVRIAMENVPSKDLQRGMAGHELTEEGVKAFAELVNTFVPRKESDIHWAEFQKIDLHGNNLPDASRLTMIAFKTVRHDARGNVDFLVEDVRQVAEYLKGEAEREARREKERMEVRRYDTIPALQDTTSVPAFRDYINAHFRDQEQLKLFMTMYCPSYELTEATKLQYTASHMLGDVSRGGVYEVDAQGRQKPATITSLAQHAREFLADMKMQGGHVPPYDPHRLWANLEAMSQDQLVEFIQGHATLSTKLKGVNTNADRDHLAGDLVRMARREGEHATRHYAHDAAEYNRSHNLSALHDYMTHHLEVGRDKV